MNELSDENNYFPAVLKKVRLKIAEKQHQAYLIDEINTLSPSKTSVINQFLSPSTVKKPVAPGPPQVKFQLNLQTIIPCESVKLIKTVENRKSPSKRSQT